jgi:hypothetical protein
MLLALFSSPCITVGAQSEMQKIQVAFKEVMSSNTSGLTMPELPGRLRDNLFTQLS